MYLKIIALFLMKNTPKLNKKIMKLNNVIPLEPHRDKKTKKLRTIISNVIYTSQVTGNENFSMVMEELLTSYELTSSERRELENYLFSEEGSVESPFVEKLVDIIGNTP